MQQEQEEEKRVIRVPKRSCGECFARRRGRRKERSVAAVKSKDRVHRISMTNSL